MLPIARPRGGQDRATRRAEARDRAARRRTEAATAPPVERFPPRHKESGRPRGKMEEKRGRNESTVGLGKRVN